MASSSASSSRAAAFMWRRSKTILDFRQPRLLSNNPPKGIPSVGDDVRTGRNIYQEAQQDEPNNQPPPETPNPIQTPPTPPTQSKAAPCPRPSPSAPTQPASRRHSPASPR